MKNLILILLFSHVVKSNAQNIVINEFMSKNKTTIQDKDDDFSDWIELYNTSNTTINLSNFSLSDDLNNPKKWSFPKVYILPNSYLVIFASSKNILNTRELHTNFKIASSGEILLLSDSSGSIIDQTEPINLFEDESYSRIPDGELNWINTRVPSPGTTNNYSNHLEFSEQEGFYSRPFQLSVNSLSKDTVYYTLNGEIPTNKSLILLDSLLIEGKTSTPNIVSEIPTTPRQELISFKAWESPIIPVKKATILRCASFRNGVRTSAIYTKSYFINTQNNYTLPIISLITEEKNLFKKDSGLYVPGDNFDINNPEWTGNYFMSSDDWEKNIHIEYFESNGSLGFSQNAGIRIHGGKTRQAAQKSLRLYARDEYGKKYFNYKLLPNRSVDKYKRFLLRTSMGSWGGQTIIKDALAQNISSTLNIDYQDFNPVIVYLNGEYWGIHTIRDKIDERYIEYTHKIDKDSVEFKEWENDNYDSLTEFISNNSLEYQVNYDYVKTQIDIDNYIDYSIAEIFLKNYDWPSNNVKLWRKIPDGKWRWVFYDIDAGFGNENYNMFLHLTENDSDIVWPNSPKSTFLFRNLIKNESFQLKFINRFSELLNNEYRSEIMSERLYSIKDIYAPDIQSHIDRWNYPKSHYDWDQDIENDLLNFLVKRPCVIREQIMTFFNLTHFGFICDPLEKGLSDSERWTISPNPNVGKFFLTAYKADIVNASISISDANGKLLFEQKSINIFENERKYFDLSFLSKGIYIFQIISNTYSSQKKIAIIN